MLTIKGEYKVSLLIKTIFDLNCNLISSSGEIKQSGGWVVAAFIWIQGIKFSLQLAFRKTPCRGAL